MDFNEIQSRLWDHMIKKIEDFQGGNIDFCDLVYELEGALNAGEFNDKKLIEQWYDYWTPLEIFCAKKGKDINIDKVKKCLFLMKNFLVEHSTGK